MYMLFFSSFRPAPFFVLDEVDAALDNTNIGKVSFFLISIPNSFWFFKTVFLCVALAILDCLAL